MLLALIFGGTPVNSKWIKAGLGIMEYGLGKRKAGKEVKCREKVENGERQIA